MCPFIVSIIFSLLKLQCILLLILLSALCKTLLSFFALPDQHSNIDSPSMCILYQFKYQLFVKMTFFRSTKVTADHRCNVFEGQQRASEATFEFICSYAWIIINIGIISYYIFEPRPFAYYKITPLSYHDSQS